MGSGLPFAGAKPPFMAPTAGPAVAQPMTPPPMHKKHHKKHPQKSEHGRSSANETGRRRNPRGGNPY